MTASVNSAQTVWGEMIALLDSRGFQSYPIADSDDSDAEAFSEVSKPLTIIQLVRGSVGVAPGHAGRSTDCFWGSREMAETLRGIWAVLEDALRKIDSGQQSIVAWCFSPPERGPTEIRKVIQVASELAPNFGVIRFPIRPMSPHLTGVRTPETALINLIGIVKVFEDVAYGDLLSEIQRRPLSNSDLLAELEKRVPRASWLGAECDRESPIPQLLTRSYSAYLERQSGADKNLTLISFLHHLEDRNNLAGISDRALASRLAADPALGALPTQVRKLVDRHQES